jgi:ATP-dependent Clp protease ATP-binding subunit ClpA
MFERFAGDSRRAVVRALDVARRQGAAQVEPEHLLLALAAEGGEAGSGGAAARALAEAGLNAQAIEDAVEQDLVAALEVVGVPASVVAATPAQPRADNPGFGVASKQVLERSLREAVARGDRRIGTEHLLLGLLDTPAVSIERLLARLDVQPWRLAALVQVEMASRR